jgi:hypothetical protein
MSEFNLSQQSSQPVLLQMSMSICNKWSVLQLNLAVLFCLQPLLTIFQLYHSAWSSVLLVEENGKNHRAGFELITLVVIGTDCTCSWKSGMTVYTTLFNIVQQTSLHRKSFFHKNKRKKSEYGNFYLLIIIRNQNNVSELSDMSTCRLLFQWASTIKFNSACWSSTKWTWTCSHWKLTCSRHDIAEKLLNWR